MNDRSSLDPRLTVRSYDNDFRRRKLYLISQRQMLTVRSDACLRPDMICPSPWRPLCAKIKKIAVSRERIYDNRRPANHGKRKAALYQPWCGLWTSYFPGPRLHTFRGPLPPYLPLLLFLPLPPLPFPPLFLLFPSPVSSLCLPVLPLRSRPPDSLKYS